MIFSELYSVYYNTVAKVLKEAVKGPLSTGALRKIIDENAFDESILTIEPALKEERWQLLSKNGRTVLKNAPTMPLTTLEKRWLKAIYEDPRIRLFTDDIPDLPEVLPLFKLEDICLFDQYSDGDPYEDAGYIERFRIILDAVKNKYPLDIRTTNRKGNIVRAVVMPEYIEYSEKDDKFRLIGRSKRHEATVNLGRIVSCEKSDEPLSEFERIKPKIRQRTLEFELTDERNALERVLLHFAHFEKEAEKTGDRKYKVKLKYDADDETEVLIRILSFGPMVKVTGPGHFINLIKERLMMQKSCEG